MQRTTFVLHSTRLWRGWLLGGLLLGLAMTVGAQEPLSWNHLTPEQQQLLEKARPKWERLSPEQQQRLLRGAERWSRMSEQEREQAAERMARLKSMPPETRRDLRERAHRFHELPSEQRERLRELHEDFRALPRQTQQQFRECQRRQRAGETGDCRALWPQALREKYADLPDPPRKPRLDSPPHAPEPHPAR